MNLPSLNGNYIDLIIFLVFVYFATEAFRHGFWVIFADFVAFLGSLVISLRLYKSISVLLINNFNLTVSISDALGFLISAILLQSFFAILLGHLIHNLPKKIRNHKFDRLLGIIPGLGEGVVLISFLITLIVALPIKPQIKNDITNSKVGGYLLNKTASVESSINKVFGGVIDNSLTYLTIHPQSGESVELDIGIIKLSVDEKAEGELFKKVNEERQKLAIEPLIWYPKVVSVARDHAIDMWERKYFSHFSLEGEDVGDRLQSGEVSYIFAGENLALAPTTITAHTGLMNSKGHRENILDPKFKKIGIGVIDNGIYGKMFVQIFTD